MLRTCRSPALTQFPLQKASMRKSPVHPNYEMDHDGNRFDLQTDFYQFLEEAKHYAIKSDFQTSSAYPDRAGERRSGEEKKKKKSWKKFLFPWLKGEKMDRTSTKPATISHVSNARQANVSGPVYGTCKTTEGRHRRPTSGPIASLFTATKKAENAMPYMCLEKNDGPEVVKTYGPVYLVT